MKTGSQKKVRTRYVVFVTFVAKIPQFEGLVEHVASAKLV